MVPIPFVLFTLETVASARVLHNLSLRALGSVSTALTLPYVVILCVKFMCIFFLPCLNTSLFVCVSVAQVQATSLWRTGGREMEFVCHWCKRSNGSTFPAAHVLSSVAAFTHSVTAGYFKNTETMTMNNTMLEKNTSTGTWVIVIAIA